MLISNAESRVMNYLWDYHPASAAQVFAALGPDCGWQEGTVKSLLNRLLLKGAIASERDGRRYLYKPIIERETWEAEEATGLIDRVFDGRLAPLVAHFSQHRQLSSSDIAELRQLIEGLDDDQ